MNKLIAIVLLPSVFLAACAEPAGNSAAGDNAAATLPSQACANASRGDFSGTWVLNTDRGANLGMMKAVKETIVASQTEDAVTFAMTDVFAGMTTERTVVYDLNGTTVPNKAAMGAESQTTTRWDGAKLVTIWAAEGAIAGTEEQRTETRCLTDGGATLNVTMTKAGNPDADEAIWFVFERSE